MNPAAKLAAFGMVLVTVLGAAVAVGGAVGPIGDDSATEDDHGSDDGHETNDSETNGSEADDSEEQSMPGGVLIASEGYRIDADTTILPAGTDQPFTFRIAGPDGEPVRSFVEEQEKELHLIVVGTDLGSYAHLHPERDGRGTWSVALPALAPGSYRAFADLAVADGPELTLGVDLSVAGEATYRPLPAPASTATVDGYEVELTGDPVAGETVEVELTATRDGEPVIDLQPYLGAFGHLVAIRGGDLAYLHVHPLGEAPDGEGARGGPSVRFALEVPSAGDYRLFFDFQHGDEVRTAAFTVKVPDR